MTWKQHRKLTFIGLTAGLAAVLAFSSVTWADDPLETPAPTATEEERVDVVAGNTAFAVDLYRYLGEQDSGNLFFSPYSISVALGMTYAGAQELTAEQMASVLHFGLGQGVHNALGAIQVMLNELTDATDSLSLRIVNQVWAQQDLEAYLVADFVERLNVNYGAEFKLIDFAADPEAARAQINEWACVATEELICDPVPRGGITEDTVSALANAIYFKGTWEIEFDEALSTERPFHFDDGSTDDVETMTREGLIAYYQGDGFVAVRLPYQGGMSMVLMLPDEGNAEFDQALSTERIADVNAGLYEQLVRLYMPSFKMEMGFNLSEALSDLGMERAFHPDLAEFRGIFNPPNTAVNFYIQNVFHKAFVEVNEEGTEAAAVTVVVVGMTGSVGPPEPPQPTIVDANRPFTFYIMDDATESVLFLGRVVDPR